MPEISTDRQERLEKANELLQVIASTGRRFFRHQDRVAEIYLWFDRLYYCDAYTRRSIYLHSPNSNWRGFSHGGTMKNLIRALKDYVWTGERLSAGIFGPWPEWKCQGDLWGYGDDMNSVRLAARELGITQTTSCKEEGALE
jgi:hypothetical protein